jgi:(p)ppGpp synthase/HD superfamily hydrolase
MKNKKKEIVRHYRALLRTLRAKLKKGDKELLRTAFEMAAEAHQTMRRKSGEPYILTPYCCGYDLCGRNWFRSKKYYLRFIT